MTCVASWISPAANDGMAQAMTFRADHPARSDAIELERARAANS
jgi:hypothetical protein